MCNPMDPIITTVMLGFFKQVISLVDQFRSATGPNKISLPTNDSDLEEK